VPRGKPGTWLDEACVPLRNRDGETSAHDGPLPRVELHAVAGGEVEPCIAGVRTDRDDRIVPETLKGQLDHLAERAGSSRASASK